MIAMVKATTLPVNHNDGTAVWKWITGLLATCMLSVFATYFAFGREIVTKTELQLELKPIQQKLDEIQHEQLSGIQAEITRQGEEIKQVQIDIARIAQKTGVPQGTGNKE
jgi:hypothetical protein